jgi:hypothetical protein
MKKEPDTPRIDELREEYDFSRGARGKYAERYGEGANIVILELGVDAGRSAADQCRLRVQRSDQLRDPG